MALYQVVFSVPGACGSGSKELEVVTLNGNYVDANLWKGVIRILKRRDEVHPLVQKWLEMSACELLSMARLGMTIAVYKAAKHPFTQEIERCGWAYKNKV